MKPNSKKLYIFFRNSVSIIDQEMPIYTKTKTIGRKSQKRKHIKVAIYLHIPTKFQTNRTVNRKADLESNPPPHN